MKDRLHISSVTFSAASFAEQRTGLLGYISCVVNRSLVLDGITVRRTLKGEVRLSFPCRTDRYGQEHSIIHPVDAAARADFEEKILNRMPGRSTVEA